MFAMIFEKSMWLFGHCPKFNQLSFRIHTEIKQGGMSDAKVQGQFNHILSVNCI